MLQVQILFFQLFLNYFMMSTFKQLTLKPRIKKHLKSSTPKLFKNPQKKAICLKLLTIKPKKPNSANRRIIKLRLLTKKIKITAKIPGESHSLQQHSVVLFGGCKIKDLIGVNYGAIRGKYDFLGVLNRRSRRSIYGIKKLS
jgi:small subunit ribosomal protein S12